MKILRIIYDWPPPWNGLAPHPYEITSAQVKRGHEVEIFCGRWPNAGKIEGIVGVKFHPIFREPFPGSIAITSSILLFFSYLAWRRGNKPDIIHSHGHFAIWIYLYRKILMKLMPWSEELTIPLVVHFHNTAKGRWVAMENEDKYITPHSKYLSWPLAVYSDKLSCMVASACIFVSEENKKEALQYYSADTRRCFVVETGVNTDLFVPAGSEEKEKSRRDLGYDNFDKIILYHGAIVERKNVIVLIDVIKKLPNIYNLFIVGTGDDVYEQKIKQRILQEGLDNRIKFFGYTPYPQVPIAYQISDVFVLPSSWEGLPKVVMQGLACGIPCVVSGFRLRDEVRGLVYLDNIEPDTIASVIQSVVQNPPAVDTNLLRQKYSWDYKIAEIEGVYDFAKKYILH